LEVEIFDISWNLEVFLKENLQPCIETIIQYGCVRFQLQTFFFRYPRWERDPSSRQMNSNISLPKEFFRGVCNE